MHANPRTPQAQWLITHTEEPSDKEPTLGHKGGSCVCVCVCVRVRVRVRVRVHGFYCTTTQCSCSSSLYGDLVGTMNMISLNEMCDPSQCLTAGGYPHCKIGARLRAHHL